MVTPIPDAPRRRRAHAADALVLACAVAVLGAAEWAARSGRVVATPPVVARCDRPVAALEAWRRAGVRGRILAHFARRLAALPDDDDEADGTDTPRPPTDQTFVRHAIEAGIVRRVVHVVSDGDWPEVRRNLLAVPQARVVGRGFEFSWQGTAIDVVRLDDLPQLAEPVVADVDVDHWTAAELDRIAARLGRPRADVVAWYGAARAFPEESSRAAAR